MSVFATLSQQPEQLLDKLIDELIVKDFSASLSFLIDYDEAVAQHCLKLFIEEGEVELHFFTIYFDELDKSFYFWTEVILHAHTLQARVSIEALDELVDVIEYFIEHESISMLQ
jgi:hypothetical protein